uniref:COesterase domain-containing protein n=1 Tax=Panagrellus redivivus TaxID=6233 RepID=A0A7E4VBE3_PANRE
MSDQKPASGTIRRLKQLKTCLPSPKKGIDGDHGRLPHPAPLNPSNNVIKTLDYVPSCYMQENLTAFIPTSEDCLYLKILTPTKPPPPESFPDLFCIHGGRFNYGGTVG